MRLHRCVPAGSAQQHRPAHRGQPPSKAASPCSISIRVAQRWQNTTGQREHGTTRGRMLPHSWQDTRCVAAADALSSTPPPVARSWTLLVAASVPLPFPLLGSAAGAAAPNARAGKRSIKGSVEPPRVALAAMARTSATGPTGTSPAPPPSRRVAPSPCVALSPPGPPRMVAPRALRRDAGGERRPPTRNPTSGAEAGAPRRL
jgi:hypothetical protein